MENTYFISFFVLDINNTIKPIFFKKLKKYIIFEVTVSEETFFSTEKNIF